MNNQTEDYKLNQNEILDVQLHQPPREPSYVQFRTPKMKYILQLTCDLMDDRIAMGERLIQIGNAMQTDGDIFNDFKEKYQSALLKATTQPAVPPPQLTEFTSVEQKMAFCEVVHFLSDTKIKRQTTGEIIAGYEFNESKNKFVVIKPRINDIMKHLDCDAYVALHDNRRAALDGLIALLIDSGVLTFKQKDQYYISENVVAGEYEVSD